MAPSMSGPFIPGVELARHFYDEAIAPLLGDVKHSAALLGWGSDVLGFDTERSTDHGWGPRLQILVERGGATMCVRRSPTSFTGGRDRVVPG